MSADHVAAIPTEIMDVYFTSTRHDETRNVANNLHSSEFSILINHQTHHLDFVEFIQSIYAKKPIFAEGSLARFTTLRKSYGL